MQRSPLVSDGNLSYQLLACRVASGSSSGTGCSITDAAAVAGPEMSAGSSNTSSSDERTIAGELGPSCSVTTVACDLVCSNSAEGRAGKTDSDVLSGLWEVGSP